MENQQSMQEQYLANIKQIIAENIGNESFSVVDLAREAGLSRSMLHRKLIKLTGKSATDLITEIRLTKALELLENDVGTVSEIAYRVGYSSPSYFNKVFKKTYKVSAGDVRRKGSGKISHLRVVKEPGVPGSARSKRSIFYVIARSNILMIIILTVSSSALILGLMDNISLFSRLHEWTIILILVILIVWFIIAIILSRVYDIQSEGGRLKTESADKVKPWHIPQPSKGWKVATYLSFVVIVCLIILNISEKSNSIRPGDIQVLLVLPFENYTGDEQLDILISGMHYSLIADLGRISNWIVFSKTTSDVYKENDMTLSQIASELGVDAIIEPAVMCFGDSICTAIKMITPDEKQIMYAEYREAKGHILNLNNRVIQQISDEVKNELTPDENRLLAESRTADPDAIDAYLQGLHYWEKVTKEDFEMAKQLQEWRERWVLLFFLDISLMI
jgi:AraC-like DNA-binding protein/TolB-like protein